MAMSRHLELQPVDKLRPCRSCSGTRLELTNSGIASYAIQCSECGTRIRGKNYNGWEQTEPEKAHTKAKASAIAAWNRGAEC